MKYVTASWVNYEDFCQWMRKSFLLFWKPLIYMLSVWLANLISITIKKVFELLWNRMLLYLKAS